MRDEEVRKILLTQNDMYSKRNISSIENSFTNNFNSRPPNDDTMNNFFDLDDRSSTPVESNKEADWHYEAEQFTPSERRFFPRNNGISFSMAEVRSTGESDDESSNPFLLAY